MRDEVPSIEELLARCETEPIHAPGGVQPHGALLGIDAAGVVAVASANAPAILGVDVPSPVGLPLAALVGADAAATLAALDDHEEAFGLAFASGPADVVARLADGLRLLEVEPTSDVDLDDQWHLFRALRGFHGSRSPLELVTQAARVVRDLTGFDRVMVYRFDPDWNGEVIAEAAAPGVDSFVGLRFPASDIPPQARALYSRARLRLIPDAAGEPSPLLAADQAAADALDLSDVALRAVSPVHLVYLRNMGVAASMSVAIMARGRLWGLIACHHLDGPRRPSIRVRAAVDLAARTTSTVLEALLDAESAARRVELLQSLEVLTADLTLISAPDPSRLLLDHERALVDLVGADGAAVVAGSSVTCVGECPGPEAVARLVAQVVDVPGAMLVTDEATRVADDLAPAAGVLVVPVAKARGRYLAWFRGETSRTVRWGGDPDAKAIVPDAQGELRLDPRSSFAAYTEVVRGRSLPWEDEEVDAAHALARRLGDAHAARARHETELAAALQRTILLERLPDIPGVETGAHYVPSAGSPLGGDWYDVFFRPDAGSILALGDVAGHGTEAAATMAQLRHALRAYVVREGNSASAVRRLNELMLALIPGEMATVQLADLDPTRGTVDLVNAGHLPALVLQDGRARFIEELHDPALGLRRDAAYRTTRVHLGPGATLVLYSDGLVERRREDLDDSLARLARAAEERADRPIGLLCGELVEALAPGRDVDDDITVLAIRFTGSPRPPTA